MLAPSCLRRRRSQPGEKLRDDEVSLLEGIVRDAFEGFDDGAGPSAPAA